MLRFAAVLRAVRSQLSRRARRAPPWSWTDAAALAAPIAAAFLAACHDQAKESAAHAAPDAAWLADLVTKDVGEVERGLPEGAEKLGTLLADGADPRQDIAGVRKALQRVRRQVIDLNVAKSTFFALTDADGVGIRNDLEEDVMAGQNLAALFPAIVKAKAGYAMGTGTFPPPPGAPPPATKDEDWIAGAPVKRPDGSTGALLVTGWSYRYFARHLQEALKTHLLDEAKASGQENKFPVYYTAVFDKAGVYAAPLTPEVDTKALASQDLVAKTAGGPTTGTLTIDDRPFGFAALLTPKLGPDTGVVVLRSDDL
jgi:hypothetical protein